MVVEDGWVDFNRGLDPLLPFNYINIVRINYLKQIYEIILLI